jgi:hypothetical protein
MFEGAHRPVERPALQGGRRSRPRRASFRAQASGLKTQDSRLKTQDFSFVHAAEPA